MKSAIPSKKEHWFCRFIENKRNITRFLVVGSKIVPCLMEPKKAIYAALLNFIAKCFGKDKAKEFDAKFRFKRKLNLKHPETLSEKICYLENHCENDLIVQCTDKWSAREYVKNKGLSDILVPTLGGPFEDAEEIDFSALPESFVIKATHGCKMNLICKSKTSFDEAKAKKAISKWLKTKYGGYSCEWHYEKIKPRVYTEEYLSDNIIDYKIMCLNGKPSFTLVCSDRDKNGHPHKNSYDLNWMAINNIVDGTDYDSDSIPKPDNYERMLDIARELSKDFLFVRVDLYDINGKIYFGELTFTPANGVLPYFSEDFLKTTGDQLDISSAINDAQKRKK